MDIVYTPGKEIPVADALSRLSQYDKYPIEDLEMMVHEVSTQFSSTILESIRVATDEDSETKDLKEIVFTGWPDSLSDAHQCILPYWNFRDEISIDDGILLKGSRIIIPKPIRPRILTQLHAAHQGIEKTKLRSRSTVYCSGLYAEIEEMTRQCEICQEYQS